MRTILLVVLTAAALLPTVARGQTMPEPEERVRLIETGGRIRMATFGGISADEIVLIDPMTGERHAVPRSAVKRFDRSLGKHRNRGTLTFGGLAVAGLIGGIWGAVETEPCRPTDIWCMGPETKPQGFAVGAILAAPVGALVGFVIGSTTRTERWEPVDLGGPWSGPLSCRSCHCPASGPASPRRSACRVARA
jgi:hypothetical protein